MTLLFCHACYERENPKGSQKREKRVASHKMLVKLENSRVSGTTIIYLPYFLSSLAKVAAHFSISYFGVIGIKMFP